VPQDSSQRPSIGFKLQSNIKLESACFREASKSQPHAPLYHYTNQAGLLGILGSGEFWATKIQYMNDATEFEYALGLAKKELEKRHSAIESAVMDDIRQEKTNALNFLKLYSPDFLERRQCKLLEWILDHLDAVSTANICAVSFCTDPDLLSQWRGYAGGSVGYAIGFEPRGLSEIAQNNACRLGRCIYEQELQEQIINELVERALMEAAICWDNSVENAHLIVGSAFERALLECGAFFKDVSFQEEREWRLITAPRGYNEPVFRFRDGKSMLTPYCALKIRSGGSWSNKIASVTVGPCPHPESARKAVEGLLIKEIGVPSPPVSVSKIPYRSW
jgi:hypothetical protein